MEDLTTGWQELLEKNVKLQEVFNRVAIGDELQMTGTLLEAMTLISAAKALSPGASCFFLTQHAALIGIESDNDSIGFVGPSISRLGAKIAEFLASDTVFTPKISDANKMLLTKFVKTTMIVSIGAGAFLAMGSDQKKNEIDKKNEAGEIYGDLLLLLVASSNFLKNAFEEVVTACGADEKTKKLVADILNMFSLLLIGVTAKRKKKDFAKVIEILNKYFYGTLQKMDEKLSTGNEQFAGVHAVVTQGLLSLKEGNAEDFVRAIDSGLELAGISRSDLEADILEIESVIGNVYGMITTGITEFSNRPVEISVIA